MATTITGTTIDVGTNVIVTDSAGNVGIGISSPAEMLEIYNTSSPAIQLNDGGDYKSIMRLAGNDLEIRGSSGSLEFYNGAADGDSSDLAMKIDNAGIVTKPLQPAFSAYRTLGDVTSGVYICNLTHFNTGGHYSIATGRFTAPVAGRYMISSMLMSQTDNTYTNKAYTIRVNDSIYKEVYGSSGSAVHHQFVWSGIIELAANDYVTLVYQNLTMYGGGSTYSTFSGNLIG